MKQSLYLLSGLLCDEVVWRAQIDALQERADVHALDFKGYHSITAMAQRVLNDAPDRFALAGHSMGARVALEVHRLAPHRVDRLALLDTGTHPAREGEAKSRQVLIDLAREHGMAAVAQRWLAPMLHPAHVDDPGIMSHAGDGRTHEFRYAVRPDQGVAGATGCWRAFAHDSMSSVDRGGSRGCLEFACAASGDGPASTSCAVGDF